MLFDNELVIFSGKCQNFLKFVGKLTLFCCSCICTELSKFLEVLPCLQFLLLPSQVCDFVYVVLFLLWMFNNLQNAKCEIMP